MYQRSTFISSSIAMGDYWMCICYVSTSDLKKLGNTTKAESSGGLQAQTSIVLVLQIKCIINIIVVMFLSL